MLFALLATIPTACDDSECEDQQQGCEEGASGASGGNNAGGNGGSGATGGNGGQGGEGGSVIPSECNPTEGATIGADCGVFVAAGANGSGTQASPFGTITQAAASLGDATRIYVCGSDTFPGSVTVSGGVSIFGGLSCDAWVYTSAQAHPKILGDEDVPALVISGAGSSRLKSLDVEAPDAVADGASSVAVVISEATVDADEMSIVANDGRDGAPPPAQEMQLMRAQKGGDGAMENSPVANAPGGMNTCGAVNLSGGLGGEGGDHTAGVKNGGPGGDGDNGAGGVGRPGESSTAFCVNGDPGVGINAPAASGAGASELGELSVDGISAADGEPGTDGANGTSGGGGGGAMANATINGAGGGGGGAGGCGGHGGTGGKGGGSSIGLVSIGASVSLGDAVILKVGSGGIGGDGAKGQIGQQGGLEGLRGPGSSLSDGCLGGAGGKGGTAGNGGGGRGGHAIAIAYVGTKPTGGAPDMTNASAGDGGLGGDNQTAAPGGQGDPGIAEPSQSF